MKRPIEVADIRKGDLIRAGFGTVTTTRLTALEYRAESDGDRYSDDAVAWQLLDRPEPSVELPTENALGFTTFKSGLTRCGVWRHRQGDERFEGAEIGTNYSSDCYAADHVTGFAPATAVPTEALDELRAAVKRNPTVFSPHAAIASFLAAVNGGCA